MKTELIVRYILTQEEANIVDDYIDFLTKNPLPCTSCPAQRSGKCTGYDIFSLAYHKCETCKSAVDWFCKSVERRSKFRDLDSEELKGIIVDRYLAELAKSEKSEIDAKVLLAQHKEKESSLRIRVSNDGKSKKLFNIGVAPIRPGEVVK